MIDVKIEKRDGKNTAKEKQEITISLQGCMCVYGSDNLYEFNAKLQALVEEYAI